MNKKVSKIRKNESGMVSMLVAMFFMIILSIMVLTFSQTARREQRQSLDAQLSSQAFYAAESGVNEVTGYIRQNFNNPALPIDKTLCANTGMPAGFPNGALGESGNITYSCVLYDTAPRTLQLDGLNTDQGRFIALDTTGVAAQKLKTVTLKWRKSGNTSYDYSNCPLDDSAGVNTLPAQIGAPGPATEFSTPCDAGMLRVMMFPIVAGSTDRNGLSENTFTVFFRPVKNAGTTMVPFIARGSSGADANAQAQGVIYPAYCNVDNICTANIDVQSQTTRGGSSSLYAHFRSVYYNNDLTVSGTMTDGSEARFNRSQIMVDVTGRAADVLKRLQVHVPLFQQYSLPSGFGIDSAGGVCKRLEVYGGYGNDSGCLAAGAYFN